MFVDNSQNINIFVPKLKQQITKNYVIRITYLQPLGVKFKKMDCVYKE